MIDNNFISVIIPTRNRSLLLEKVLKSLLGQTLSSDEFEVMVIDNGSTDTTRDVVEAAIPLLPNLRYVYEPHPGLHAGRHRGFQEAQGDILIYADDDIEAFPTWLTTIKTCFMKQDVAMVGGKNLPKFETPPPDWLLSMWEPNTSGERVLGYLSILDLGDAPKAISPYFIFGCNFAIRRSVLEAAGGFHPDGMPQELIRYRGDGESYVSHYVQTKGYQAFYHPQASVYHWVSASRMTSEYFCRRAYNQGISDSYTHLRKVHGLSPQLDLTPPKSTEFIAFSLAKLHDIYRRFQGKSLTQISVRLLSKIYPTGHFKPISPAAAELEQIKQQMHQAYHAGYTFHQQTVSNDSTLLAWVLKPDYWDYRLPDPLLT
jgi:glycosyltransferase involved in cell wall biosynthesis